MADRNTHIKRDQLSPIRSDDLDALNSPSVGQVPSLGSGGQFEWVDQPIVVAFGIFELDINGDLMPILGTELDTYYELDGNGDIEPKT